MAGKTFAVVFFKTIQFLYRLGSGPKDLYEVQNDHSFLEEALLQNYGYKPTNHPFKFFQLEDIDDFPFIQVVAESVKVFKD